MKFPVFFKEDEKNLRKMVLILCFGLFRITEPVSLICLIYGFHNFRQISVWNRYKPSEV